MPFGWGRPKEEPVLVPAGAGARGGGGGGGGHGTAPAPPQAAGRNRVPAGGYAPPNQQPMRPQPKQLLDAGAVAIAYWGAAPDYIKLCGAGHTAEGGRGRPAVRAPLACAGRSATPLR